MTILIEKYILKEMPELEENKTLVDQTVQQYMDLVSRNYFKARHILVKTQEEAESLRQRILNGEDFEKLAENYSLDPGTAKLGGELGWFTEGQMVKEFEDALKTLKPGELSQPVKTQFGYHLIEMEEKRAGSKISEDEARMYVKYRLFSTTISKNAKKFLDFVEEKKKNADIKIYYQPTEEDNTIELSDEDVKQLTQEATSTTSNEATTTLKETTTSMATTTTSKECSAVYFYYIPGPSSSEMEKAVDELISSGANIAKANYLNGGNDCIKSNENTFPQLVCTRNNKVSVGKKTKEEITNFVSECLS